MVGYSHLGRKGGYALSLEIFLIDFENVQPTGVGRLVPGACRIMLFLGQNQNKVPVELTRALQPFGTDVEYLNIAGSGPNAVDFHIAFYIGHLAPRHPGATFTIVSADTGFDPLVRHLTGTLDIGCRRITALPAQAANKAVAAEPVVQAPGPTAVAVSAAAAVPTSARRSKNVEITVLPAAKSAQQPKPKPKPVAADVATFTEQVVVRLKGLKRAKPATLKTLTSSLTAWATPAPGARVVPQVIASLKNRNLIVLEGTKVSYQLK